MKPLEIFLLTPPPLCAAESKVPAVKLLSRDLFKGPRLCVLGSGGPGAASAGSVQAGGSLQRAAPGAISHPRLLPHCKVPVVSPFTFFFFFLSPLCVCSALFPRDLAPRGLAAAGSVYSDWCRKTVIGVTHRHVRDCSWNDSFCSDLTSSHLPLCSVMKAAEDADA